MAIIKESVAGMKAEISLVENMIYVVKDEKIHPIEPGFNAADDKNSSDIIHL
ncbi:hypothetical protein [Bacillus cereus group sp. BfR-BA-01428]|uniref:hypothetical protein n=1 Tax=Bacillus cereus group sp. BfR-BA-01428 TaxID=2920345 RepID=UPI001F57C0D6|nr:hypothetical protein [Bacillus cereus]MDA1845386.1 hypothetical protein [Bacillus cereus]